MKLTNPLGWSMKLTNPLGWPAHSPKLLQPQTLWTVDTSPQCKGNTTEKTRTKTSDTFQPQKLRNHPSSSRLRLSYWRCHVTLTRATHRTTPPSICLPTLRVYECWPTRIGTVAQANTRCRSIAQHLAAELSLFRVSDVICARVRLVLVEIQMLLAAELSLFRASDVSGDDQMSLR
jgi:hypothetical protein